MEDEEEDEVTLETLEEVGLLVESNDEVVDLRAGWMTAFLFVLKTDELVPCFSVPVINYFSIYFLNLISISIFNI